MKKTAKTAGIYALIIAGMFLLFPAHSCKFQSNMQTEGAPFLQGVWKQEALPLHNELQHYALHEFRFTCDSVYVVMQVHARQNTVGDVCYGDGRWTEYAKGIYVVRGDSLLVDGIYTQANGRQKISGCYRIGQYIPRFRIVRYTADSVYLENRFDQVPLTLAKTDMVTCVPKPR